MSTTGKSLLALAGILVIVTFGGFCVFHRSALDRRPTSAAAPPPTVAEAPAVTLPPALSSPLVAPATRPPASGRPPAHGAAPRPTTAVPPGFESGGAAAAPPPMLTRTGGRTAAAIRDQGYYVLYEPQPSKHLARVSPRALAFEVLPFRQNADEPVADGFHVERAGEIVSAALALQLESMGYTVSLELAEALADLRDRLDDRFRVDVARFGAVASFGGDVRFQVRHTRQEARHVTTGAIDVAARLTVRRAGRSRLAYERRIRETESAEGASLGGASDRARSVAAGAVQRFVRTLLGDPRLEQALADGVR
jgi:hypothetical protein